MATSDDTTTPSNPAATDTSEFGGRMIDLHGTGPARGAVHGEQLREVIAEGLERWRDHIAEQEGCPPTQYIANFLGSTNFIRTVRDLSFDLYEEVQAIAAASNQPADDVMAYNFMDQEWLHSDTTTGCSVIGTVLADRKTTLLSQNMDLPKSMDGSQAILRIAADDRQPGQLVLTAAGMIGLFGVNAAGVACCVNTLRSLPSGRSGMPVAFLVRQILNHTDATSAGSYLASVPHASGQHYAIADRHGLRGYECSADGCVAGPQDDHLLHTNHPLWTESSAAANPQSATSLTRLHALEDNLHGTRLSGQAETLLSSTDTGLCVQPGPDQTAATFCSAEFILTSPPTVRIALGRPNEVPWKPVSWHRPLV